MPNFSEIVRCIVDMMKGNKAFKWSDDGNKAFKNVKGAIAKAPILFHPNYTEEFIIYCYALEHTMSIILM